MAIRGRLKIVNIAALSIFLAFAGTAPAHAQNVSSGGQNWSGSWGFSSPSDRNLVLQRALAIQKIENPPPPPTVNNTSITSMTNNVTTVNDSRRNYIESSNSDVSGDFEYVGGDKIGQKTYAVGSINTGDTRISVTGDNNDIFAENSANSNGCVDAGISTSQQSYGEMIGSGRIDISVDSSSTTQNAC